MKNFKLFCYELLWRYLVWTSRYRRKPTLFPINVWSCYSYLEENIPWKNNSIEDYNNEFSSTLYLHDPSIYTSINAKKKPSRNLNKMKIEPTYYSGLFYRHEKKVQDIAERLKNVCEDYATRTMDDYLSDITHNFQLNF